MINGKRNKAKRHGAVVEPAKSTLVVLSFLRKFIFQNYEAPNEIFPIVKPLSYFWPMYKGRKSVSATVTSDTIVKYLLSQCGSKTWSIEYEGFSFVNPLSFTGTRRQSNVICFDCPLYLGQSDRVDSDGKKASINDLYCDRK